MANTTIANLPTVIALNGSEPLLGVQSSSSVQITTGQIASLANGSGGLPFAVSIGGTGRSSFTQYGLIYGNGTSPLAQVGLGTTGQVLIGNTGGAPTWASTVPSTAAVTSIAFGTTGLTPATATTGAVTVAGTLVAANGGTGLTGYTIGDILYASGATTLAALADVATGNALISGGVGVAPSWGKIGLTTHVSGILPIANGGTNASTAPAANANLQTWQSTASATQTLTNTSPYYEYYTGTTTTVTLPVTSTLQQGWSFHMANNGSGNVTVNSSGGNLVATILPQMTAHVTCILTSGTTAASWDAGYTDFGSYTGSGAVVLATSPTLVTPVLGAATATSLAIGGATLGTHALAVTGTSTFNNNIGLGGNATTFIGLANSLSITGATSAYGERINGNVQSGVTTLAAAYFSNIALANATFTTTDLVHFLASPPSGGAGSTATNQYGFRADSTLGSNGAATVTNSYGFYSNLASAANKWNFFANGTANNAFAGNVRIGSTTAPTVALDVTGAALISTTLGVTTSTTVPLVIGGTAVGSTLTLQSTSGVGTTDSVIVKTGNNGAVTAATFNTAGVATSVNWYNTATQTATNTATLTAAQITSPFLLGTPTATASYTLPLASAVETALGTPPNETGWEFTVFTTAAFAITLLTNTGWTLVGSMATGATANSFARFRIRKTGAAAYSIYRIS
jgi:hypothetical protein